MSSSDISLPSSPSQSPAASPDPYAFSSDEITSAAPPAKKPGPRNLAAPIAPHRTWPASDEVVLLESVAAHKDQHGGLPSRADLAAALAGCLPHVTPAQAAMRLKLLRDRYERYVRRLRRGTVPVTDDDVRIFRLSKRLWEGVPRKRKRRPRAAPHHETRPFEEMQRLYPCLAAEVEARDGSNGTMMRMAFGRMGDEQAAKLEAKLKRQKLNELKNYAQQAELKSMVIGAIIAEID
jgi:hypothetical protein